MDRPPPLPRQVAWFAPWTWKWRAKLILAALLFAAYLESPVPMLVMERSGVTIPKTVLVPLSLFWIPLGIAYKTVPAVEWFYDTQAEIAEAVLNRLAE